MRKNVLKFFMSLFVALAIFSLVMPPAIMAKPSRSRNTYKSYKSPTRGNYSKPNRYKRPDTSAFKWGRNPEPKKTKKAPVTPVLAKQVQKKPPVTPLFNGKDGKKKPPVTPVLAKGGTNKPPVTPVFNGKDGKKKPPVTPVVAKDISRRGPPKVEKPKTKIKPKALAGVTNKDLNASLKQRAAADTIKKNREKYTKPANISSTNVDTKNRLYANTVTHQTKTVTEITIVRDDFYRRSPQPIWINNCSPVHGMWEMNFLSHSLMHANYDFFYHHQHDRGIQDALAELRLQARENAELAVKYEEMQRQLARMEKEGVTRNEEYLPEGVSPEIAMATELVAKQDIVESKPVLTMSTGGINGVYYKTGEIAARIAESIDAPFTINVATSPGSNYNLNNFGIVFDMIMFQSDTGDLFLSENKAKSIGPIQQKMYDEYFMFFKNEKCSVDNAGELDPKKHMIIVGPKGSGPEGSWENIKKKAMSGFFGENKYNEIQTINMPYNEGLEMVAKNPNVFMLYVAGMNNGVAKTADTKYAGKIKLIPFQESRFLKAEDREGNDIYAQADIPGIYENLQPKGWIYGNDSTESLTVMATMAISPKIIQEHPEWENDLKAIIMLTKAEIRQYVGQE